jgi:hypothetical protein
MGSLVIATKLQSKYKFPAGAITLFYIVKKELAFYRSVIRFPVKFFLWVN